MFDQTVRMLSRIVYVGFLCLGLVSSPESQAQNLQDDSLRANYLVGFVDFVRWERTAHESTTIAVLGSKSLYNALQKVAELKRTKGRNFKIVEVNSESDLDKIDLLYVGIGHEADWTPMINRAKELSIVTVGEEPGFLDAGGLIEFTIQRNRLRFSLNLEEADRYQVAMSSKLVQLAVN